MGTRIYKEVFFEATHRLIHYRGKCFRLHGHQWRVEVWIEGTADERTGIVLDYNCIKEVVGQFDHQVILNAEDPMVASIEAFHPVVTTPGDPTSESRRADSRYGQYQSSATGARCTRGEDPGLGVNILLR